MSNNFFRHQAANFNEKCTCPVSDLFKTIVPSFLSPQNTLIKSSSLNKTKADYNKTSVSVAAIIYSCCNISKSWIYHGITKLNIVKILLCSLLLYFACTGLIQAQQSNLNFTSLQIKDGLSSNTVNAIVKDHFGLMWFGTEDGLNKYDGSDFTVYRFKADDPSGLQANDIRALHEDKFGNLWIGTSGGSLSLFDRKKDTFVTFPAKVAGGLSSDIILSITSDYRGKIWVATYNGVDEIDPETKKIKNHINQSAQRGNTTPLSFNCLFEDSKRRMWIGSTDGVYLYNRKNNKFNIYRHNPQDPSSVSENHISAIAEDQSGDIWFGTNNSGLCKILPGEKKFKLYSSKVGDNSSLTNNSIRSLAIDNNNHLWVGTEDGLNIIDIQSESIQHYKPNSRSSYSLTGKAISCIYIDDQGIYWLGPFHGGISKYDTNLNLFNLKQSNILDYNGLSASVVTSFAPYKDRIFVGTDGGGLNLFNPRNALVERFSTALSDGMSLSNLSIMTLAVTRSQKLYIGTYSNGLVIKNLLGNDIRQIKKNGKEDGLNSNDIFCIKEDRRGTIWIGTNGAGVNLMDRDNKVMVRYLKNPVLGNDKDFPGNNFIRFIEEDQAGNIWIGTYGSGISIFNPSTEQFTVLDKAKNNLPNNLTLSVLRDRQGNLWIGTFSGGLSLYDRQKNKFVNFSEQAGLNNSTVYAIVEDEKGQIWVSTNKGISCFDRGTKRFTNYTTYNGVQNNNFVRGAGIKTAEGVIYFGGSDGFNYFNPKYFKKNRSLPSVLLTDLKIANISVVPSADGAIQEQISIAKDIYLDFKQNFTLNYVSVNYTSPEDNQYAYKLEGLDKDWIHVGSAKSVSYTNLDPGDYIFRVKANNNDGLRKSSETAINIHVRPPFWRSIYAYLFYFAAVIGAILYMRHRGIEKLKRNFAQVQDKMRAEQLLEQQRIEAEQLRALDKLKIKFLTNLSHEFRTPLSLIIGPIDRLVDEQNEQQIAAPLLMIKRNTRRLLNLVNQILDFRKIEDQELKLNAVETDIVAFVKEVLESFNDLSERKQVQLVFKSQFRYFKAAFDQDKIERVLFNLLSNAFKFTPTGGSISVELEKIVPADQQDGSVLVIKVADTGIGISETDRKQIFNRFFQVDGIAPILNQGSGIGLSIAQEFVKLHGGEISVRSEEGEGSVFSITIPFSNVDSGEELLIDFSGVPDHTSSEEVEPATDQSNTEMPTILLVEDNEDFRAYLRDGLRQFYKIYEAANGQEGWQKALSNHPQIIVSDINMPYMSGIELCKKVKTDKRTNHIPIILLTALTGEEQQLKGLETGANDYLSKPFNFEILNAKIKNLLSLNKRLRDTYTKQIKVQAPEVIIESHSDRLLNKIAFYIDENLNNPKLSVEDLSRHVGMSRG
ncbi:MAG: response regulator, partial [Pedobacter sp.]